MVILKRVAMALSLLVALAAFSLVAVGHG